MTTEQVEMLFQGDGSSSQWVVQQAQLSEQLNTPYRLALTIATEDMDAEPARFLGQPASLTILRGESFTRTVTGIVGEVVEGSTHPEMVTANIVVVPALEGLRHRINTKIFQSMTVPEILEDVLGEGLGGYDRSVDNRLERTYPKCYYRVQYDESDLAFCQRLMEEEGIVYWFEFEGETETMVLADAPDEYGEIESLHDKLLLYSESEGNVEGQEYVSSLIAMSQIQPTKLATRHFAWTSPAVPLEGESSESAGTAEPNGAAVEPEREVYQHDEIPLTREPGADQPEPPGTVYGNDKDDQLTVRRQEQAWESRIAEGESTVMGMTIGALFELVGHPRADLDGKYLVYGVTHSFDSDEQSYRNAFQCIPEEVPFRPKRISSKPQMPSIQTATVVGPSGEEIHTDEHGRIKVQFHWDRLGANDESSSCWIRVMQPWAGAGWGFVFIPRIGMEVIVDFVCGDPDQPVVVGSLYNGEHPPPYPLPDEKTKSTIKSESSLGGGGFNEIRFEDMAGSEEIYTHAQKDQNEVVENDHTTTVGHDQTNTVGNNQLQEIVVNQTEKVGGNQEMEVEGNRTTHIMGAFEETIDGSETRTVSSGATENVDAGETRTITGGMTEDISGGREQTISGDSTETITGAVDQTIVGGATITTPASYMITAVGGFKVTAPAGSKIVAPGGYTLLAPGGTTSHDSFFEKIGNDLFELYSGSMGLTAGLKLDLVAAFGAAINGTNLERKACEISCVKSSDNEGFLSRPKTRALRMQQALAETDGQAASSE